MQLFLHILCGLFWLSVLPLGPCTVEVWWARCVCWAAPASMRVCSISWHEEVSGTKARKSRANQCLLMQIPSADAKQIASLQ